MGAGDNANVMGLIVSGDVGDYTIYTDRFGKKVAFPKSPPKEPPTDLQVAIRDRFKTAQAAYMACTPQEKANWELLVQKASLCLTGQNLYISVAMTRRYGVLDTIMSQTGITVTPPNPV